MNPPRGPGPPGDIGGAAGHCGSDLDDVQRSHRIIQDLVRRLDDGVSRSSYVADLFSPELSLYRAKLADHVLRLVVAEPLKHGVGAIDAHWRKAVYETIVRARNIKQGWTPMERAYMVGHLLNGIGFYDHFLWVVVADFGWSKKVLDALGDVAMDFTTKNPYGHSKISQSKQRSWGQDSEFLSTWLRKVVHGCLMRLGDLCRYLMEFEPDKITAAQRFYHQALLVDFSQGLPYNQLATLAGSDRFGLNAVFYYLRCLTCQKPFEGADSNLRKLLERNARDFAHFDADIDEGSENSKRDVDLSNMIVHLPVLSAPKETERCVVFLLQLVKVFLYEETVSAAAKLSKLCQKALQCVQHCLYLHMDESGSPNPPEDVALKMVLVLLLLMGKLKKQESKLSMLRAYLLALFSHMVTKLLGDLHLKLFGPEALLALFEHKKNDEEKENLVSNGAEKSKETKESSRKKKVPKLERLKRRKNRRREDSSGDDSCSSEGVDDELIGTGSSDGDAAGTEPEDDESETENEDSARYASNRLLHSESEDNDDHDFLFSDSSEDDSDDSESDVIIESSTEILSTLNLVKIVGGHHLNMAIRVCGLWLYRNTGLVREAGMSGSDVLWSRLAQLFTMLSLQNPQFEAHLAVDEAAEKMKESGRIPFPEDQLMRGMEEFKGELELLDWDKSKEALSGEVLTGVLRVYSYYALRDWLCDMRETKMNLLEHGRVEILAEMKPSTTLSKASKKVVANGKLPEEEQLESEEEVEKAKMMQNMARLWLRQEVNDLEGDGGRRGRFRGFAHYSPYIVVDHLAISRHLHMIKEVVASKKFAVIIPTVVIHNLDGMKNHDGGARTAIRWLERQFQDGNRWLRPQRKHEFRTLDMLQYPKKKEREACNYFKILECCNYFAAQRADDDSTAGKIQVTLLTAAPEEEKNDCEDQERNVASKKSSFSPHGLALAINIRVQNVDTFIRQASEGTETKGSRRKKENQKKKKR